MGDALRLRLRTLLVERYAHLRRKLEFIVGSRDSAADALQETWLRLETVPDAGTVRNADAYLLQIAVNAAHDQHRRDQRLLDAEAIDALFDVEDELADPQRVAAARSEVRALETVMRGLSVRQREILVAAQIDGLLNREIAERLDISPSLVEKELRRALQACEAGMDLPVSSRRRAGGRRHG